MLSVATGPNVLQHLIRFKA